MKRTFTLPQFPESSLEFESSLFTGSFKLWKDGEQYTRSPDHGRPFHILADNGELYQIYPKRSLFKPIPALEINGITYDIVEKLPWYKYALAFVPMVLIFIGGGLGGAIGAVGTTYNLEMFRRDLPPAIQYLAVIGISVLAYITYLVLGTLALRLFE